MKKLNIYITGANGFIGSGLIKYFKKYDNLNIIGISFSKNNFKTNNLIYTDYNDIKWLRKNIKSENSVIVHTAAYIPKSSEEFLKKSTLDINKQIDKFICKAFLDKVSKFVYFSSIAVYGYGYKDLINIIEESPLYIRDYYAQSKLQGEELVLKQYIGSYVLRLSSPYGKYKGKKNILDSMINKAINGENIQIYGKGNRTQDFIHIDDVCKVIHRIIDKNISTGIYNLASGYPCEMSHLAKIIINTANSQSNIEYMDRKESDFVKINNDKLKVETAMKFINIETGIKKMFNLLQIKGE